MNDGQVVFEIKGDPKNVNQTVKHVTDNIQQESRKWDQAVDDSMDKAGKSFLNWKTVAAGAITAIGAAVVKFGREAIGAASDLAEVQNVVDTVFGDDARVIDNWSQKAGEKFGLTETMAKRFTSTLGAMMKSSGLAGKEITSMSTDLAGLAADMASFYNLDFETAFQKIRSGISGETEPLKQLGINMSVANLEAFALAQGLEKTFSEMSQGEQTMLRYQYIMQATADAQGDFEKTSDGFANAQRRIQSSLESIKTSVGKLIIDPFANATAGVAEFLAKIAADMMPEKTVIDEFNEIEVDAEQKLADIQKTYETASDLIKILKEIEQETVTLQDGSTISLSSLFGDLGEIEKNGGNIEEYIAGLGLDVEYVVLQYNKWKEATKQLTSTIPSLTGQIDSETGAINGGTDALQKNLDEWKRVEENKVYWAEYYAKAEAVARAKGEQAGIQITARARQLAAEREAKKLAEQYGTTFSDGRIWDRFTGEAKVKYESGEFNNAEVDEAFENYNRLITESEEANKKAKQSANDLADAEALLADELKATEEITGETIATVQRASDANKNAAKDTSDAWKQSVATVQEAIKAMTDYAQSVHDATAQAVNSVISGFDSVHKAGDEFRTKSNELAAQEAEALNKYTDVWQKWGSDNTALRKMQEYVDAGGKLTDAEKQAYEALVNVRNAQNELNQSMEKYQPETMAAGLQSQIDYMQEYLDNLEKARELGYSNDLMASLSDGSAESAEYLNSLVNSGQSKEDIEKLNKLYSDVQSKKKEFTDGLTEQKLAVDETYQAMVDKAKEAVGEMFLGEEASSAMADLVGGLASGLNENEGQVAAAVQTIIDDLNRLNTFGVSINLGTFGSINFTLNGSHATGLDYVPFNGYLAELHEGEGILTAEENRIWQRFKNGGAASQNVDYSALGDVMRDNVKPGGDVYLDGRVVGSVISKQQANSYRSLQRSGWQQ